MPGCRKARWRGGTSLHVGTHIPIHVDTTVHICMCVRVCNDTHRHMSTASPHVHAYMPTHVGLCVSGHLRALSTCVHLCTHMCQHRATGLHANTC